MFAISFMVLILEVLEHHVFIPFSRVHFVLGECTAKVSILFCGANLMF